MEPSNNDIALFKTFITDLAGVAGIVIGWIHPGGTAFSVPDSVVSAASIIGAILVNAIFVHHNSKPVPKAAKVVTTTTTTKPVSV